MQHKNIALTAALALTSLAASAQVSQTGLLNEGYFNRHELNPALQNGKGYISLPVIGGTNVALRGNTSLTDFIYNRGGHTVTFLNPQVTTAEALGAFSDKMRLGADVRTNLLAVGMKIIPGGYSTIGANLRMRASVGLPGDLFRMAKEGPMNRTYDLSTLGANAEAFGEVYIGHSQKIGEHLTVGAKVKFLLGLAAMDAKVNEAVVTLGEDAYVATTDAEIRTSMKGFSYETETKMRGPEGHQTPHTYVTSMNVDDDELGPSGKGFAVDLGATYTLLNNDLRLGLSVLDLGMINWNHCYLATTGGPHTISTSKYVFSVDGDADNGFENEAEIMGEGTAALYELQDMGDQGSRSRALGATVNAFAEYRLPVYHPLTFGLSGTGCFHGDYQWMEGRISVNLAPTKWFALSVSAAEGTFGPSVGWMLSLHPKGFSILAGMDHLFTQVAKQGIPLSNQSSFTLGINFPF